MGCTVELSISKASVTWGVSRTTIHKKIKTGQLSKLANGTIDTSEMVRVFGEPNVKIDTANSVQVVSEVHPDKLLEQRVRHLETSLSESKERETWLQNQVGNLTDTIKLLDAPKAPKNRSWVTWMLTIVCVALCVAVIAMVIFFVQHRWV
jgi:hypothetical protein